MITVWGRASSSNVQAVLWCLHELGIEYHRIDAGFTYGVTKTDEYRQMNPNSTVPTIVDGTNPPLYESGAILRYLANVYAPDAFWPTEPAQRAVVDMWAEWSKINVALNFTGPLFWPLVRMHESKRDYEQIAQALRKFESNLEIADKQLSDSAFLASNKLTLADIQFGHLLYRYFDIDLVRADLGHVRRYYQNLTERPAFRDTVMVSYEELRNSM